MFQDYTYSDIQICISSLWLHSEPSEHKGFKCQWFWSKTCHAGWVWEKCSPLFCPASAQSASLSWEVHVQGGDTCAWSLCAGFRWGLWPLLRGFPGPLGLPPDMVAGVQKQPSQGELIASEIASLLPSSQVCLYPRTEDTDPYLHGEGVKCMWTQTVRERDDSAAVYGKHDLPLHTRALRRALSRRMGVAFWWALRNGRQQQPLSPVSPWECACIQCHLSYVLSVSAKTFFKNTENCLSQGPAFGSRKKKGKEKTRQTMIVELNREFRPREPSLEPVFHN